MRRQDLTWTPGQHHPTATLPDTVQETPPRGSSPGMLHIPVTADVLQPAIGMVTTVTGIMITAAADTIGLVDLIGSGTQSGVPKGMLIETPGILVRMMTGLRIGHVIRSGLLMTMLRSAQGIATLLVMLLVMHPPPKQIAIGQQKLSHPETTASAEEPAKKAKSMIWPRREANSLQAAVQRKVRRPSCQGSGSLHIHCNEHHHTPFAVLQNPTDILPYPTLRHLAQITVVPTNHCASTLYNC